MIRRNHDEKQRNDIMKFSTANEKIRTAVVAFVALVALAAVVSALPGSDADTGETTQVDLGQIYSMKVQYIFSGSDASSILWDFGDGETSTDWNPLHEYTETGVYHGYQIAYNDYNGGSETRLDFTVEVMGYPEITFVSNGGSEVTKIEQTAHNTVAEKPADPVKEGFEFAGWFVDEDLSEAMDWTSGVKKDITLYAGWKAVGGEAPADPANPEPGTPAPSESLVDRISDVLSENFGIIVAAAAILAILGIALGTLPVSVLAIIVAIVAALAKYGVF